MRIVGIVDDLAPVANALRAGEAVALPTDTVYGIACDAAREDACLRLLAAKGRDRSKPTALVAGSVSRLVEQVLPEFPAGLAALLPGPLTVVVPNPAGRFPWLCGDTPGRIGVRVPAFDPRIAALVDGAGSVMMTSANAAGGAAATVLAAVPAWVAIGVDGGPMSSAIASTVVDLTGSRPTILRAGTIALEQIEAALR